MDNNYLLTYDIPVPYEGVHCISTYAWFETEEELRDFVQEKTNIYGDKFKVNEAFEIINGRELDCVFFVEK